MTRNTAPSETQLHDLAAACDEYLLRHAQWVNDYGTRWVDRARDRLAEAWAALHETVVRVNANDDEPASTDGQVA